MPPNIIKTQQEVAIKEWRKNFIEYGMTPSTTDNPPEGFYEFVEEPEAVETWIETIIADTIATIGRELEARCEGQRMAEKTWKKTGRGSTSVRGVIYNQAIDRTITLIRSVTGISPTR